MPIELGSIVLGKVVKVMPFGAFVSLDDNKSGLIHISEITSEYIEDINDYIKVGDKVKVKVISIDDGKISLSIKKTTEQKRDSKNKPVSSVRPAEIDWSSASGDDLSFEDKLSRFKKDSDERMLALKRSNDSKRSGRNRRGGNSY